MFFPAQLAADYGVACFDLWLLASHAGTRSFPLPVPALGAGRNYPAMIEGSAAVGTSLYFYGSENNAGVFTPILYCFDAATQAPCAGGARVDLSTAANGTVVGWNPGVNGRTAGWWSSSPPTGAACTSTRRSAGHRLQVSCFDTATQTACPGWATPLVLPDAELLRDGLRIVPPRSRTTWSPRDVRRHARRVPRQAPCRAREEECVAADKSPLPPVPVRAAPAGRALRGQPRAGHLRAPARPLLLRVFRRDLRRSQRVCVLLGLDRRRGLSGFNPARRWDTSAPPDRNPVNGGHTSDYAYTYDQATGCMWGLGDAGFLWSFDARTGDNPCRVGKQAVELVSPTAFYCDGKPGHVQGWDAVRFVSTHLDAFAEIRVTLLDSTGAPVPGFTDVALLAPDQTRASSTSPASP